MRWLFVTLVVISLLVLEAGSVAAAPQESASFTARVLDLTNAERQKAGLAPLVLNDRLADAAQAYSQVLASSGCFDHTCGPVPNFAERDGQAGYTNWIAIGENIAAGYPTPEAVVAGWMASAGHRANILSPNYTEIGIGVVSAGDKFGTYWTQEFGSRYGESLAFAPLLTTSEDGGAPPADGDATDH